MLKPYIWRDFSSLPPKLEIAKQIARRGDPSESTETLQGSIDYVHLRPEHVLSINSMCEKHFWNGIDVSECLHFPDHTIVALYKKLIIGFALMVPLQSNAQEISTQQQQQPGQLRTLTESHSMAIGRGRQEMYLSFIFVHPDWRECHHGKRGIERDDETNVNVSIGQYMLYYLIKVLVFF